MGANVKVMKINSKDVIYNVNNVCIYIIETKILVVLHQPSSMTIKLRKPNKTALLKNPIEFLVMSDVNCHF